MVKYVFSDKTGTLTQNIMEFKKFTAGRYSYGVSEPSPQTYAEGLTNVNFEDNLLWRHLEEPYDPNYRYLRSVIEILGLCHTVMVEEKHGKNVFNSSSPDELALVNAAKHFGF